MKTKFIIAFVAIGLTSISCKKEKQEETTTPSSPLLKGFYLKVDGTPYTATGGVTQHTSGLILHSTTVGTNLAFSLRIADTLQAGTYDIVPNGNFRLSHTDDNYATPGYASISGSVTVEYHDASAHKIAGTYHCVIEKSDLSATKQITNAEFNITYPE